jgi:ABC-type cobalt transport system substrate-binding protein
MNKREKETLLEKIVRLVENTRSSLVLSVIGAVGSIILSSFDSMEKAKPEMNNLNIVTLVFFVPIILAALERLITLKNEKSKIRKKYPGLSVVGILALKRERNSNYAISAICIGLMIYLLCSSFAEITTNRAVILILMICVLLIFTREKLISYRVSKGYFGQNESEAREIIKFIINNSENIDFTDGGKRKSLFNKADIKKILDHSWQPQSATT